MIRKLKSMPKRKISEVEKDAILLRIELSKIRREKADTILNKGVILYFGFLTIALIGLFKGFFNNTSLTATVLLGLMIIIFAAWEYAATIDKEEKELEEELDDLY